MQEVVGRAANEGEPFVLAGAVLDDRADSSASSQEHQMRKQRLLDGPAEFREVRVDRSEKTSSDAD